MNFVASRVDVGGSPVDAPPAVVENTPQPPLRDKAAQRAQLYAIYLVIDLVAITVGVGIATALRFGLQPTVWAPDVLTILLPLHVLLALNIGAFQLETLTSTTYSMRKGVTAFIGALIGAVIILFLLKASSEYSRLAFLFLVFTGGGSIAAGRIATRLLSRHLLGDRVETSVLLVDGAHPVAVSADIYISAAAQGLKPSLTDPEALDRLGRALRGADRVIVACPAERRLAWASTLKGIGIVAEILAPELDVVGAIGTGRLGDRATMVVGRGPLGTRDRLIKRAFDLILVCLSAPITLVICGIVALAVKLDTRGPALFTQTRVGEGNRQFRMHKFRSMRVDRLDGDGRKSTLRDDDRVTRVGRIIRATSLDELPQLWNVLMGEMSIVGPRPHALGSTAESHLFWEIDERYWQRHAAKPGLTGLAQVRGHRGATETRGALVDRIQSDLEYVVDWSIWRDMRILVSTLRVLFFHRNAY